MKIIESFTIYGKDTLNVSKLNTYSSVFTIESVRDYNGAFDLIPKENLSEDQIADARKMLISDPQIMDFDESYEDIMSVDFEPSITIKSLGGGVSVEDDTADDFLWHHKIMDIEKAWEITESGKKSKGEGIIIAHPDSGLITHPELCPGDERILKESQLDLVDLDYDPNYEKATHGLATASVILGNEEGLIKGIAPKALLIPIRIAKVEKLFPTPVLFGGGMRRLRKSIEHSIDSKADIVSISLGGIKSLTQSRALKGALEMAKKQGIIVMAAAGNNVGFVVYPAKYDSVIAVAASNYFNEAWDGSCRGNTVDITAPGENVWKADISKPNKVKRSSGTSYAVANTAGVAALWLAHWGKNTLEEIFGGKDKLVDGFIRMIKDSATTDTNLPDSDFGAGIINAKKLLQLHPSHFI